MIPSYLKAITQGKNLLYTEDDPRFQQQFLCLISPLGFQVTTESSLSAGWQEYQSRQFDLFVTDFDFGEEARVSAFSHVKNRPANGADLVRKIRENNKDLVCVVLTAFEQAEAVKEVFYGDSKVIVLSKSTLREGNQAKFWTGFGLACASIEGRT